jgi:hypothetical protein
MKIYLRGVGLEVLPKVSTREGKMEALRFKKGRPSDRSCQREAVAATRVIREAQFRQL